MSAKHTPGPWFLGQYHGRCHLKHASGLHTRKGDTPCEYKYTLEVQKNECCVSYKKDGRGYTLVGYDDNGPILSHEDACLISAAPDLLAACEHAAMEWRLHGSLTDSCRVLEAAINKAQGES